jgi:hypothetical protein
MCRLALENEALGTLLSIKLPRRLLKNPHTRWRGFASQFSCFEFQPETQDPKRETPNARLASEIFLNGLLAFVWSGLWGLEGTKNAV